MKVRTLIADDEPPARGRLRALLEDEGELELVGECGDGRETVAAVRALRPDLVLLDVQMPEADGFEVIREIGAADLPAVVFVTAYDQYALRAFEAHALDYLLKPVDPERFREAVRRATEHVHRRRALDPRIVSLLAELRPTLQPALERIPTRVGGRIRMIPTSEIDYIEAEGSYVRIHAGGDAYLLRESLGAMERKLDPARFVRVHRSLVVNVDRVHELEPFFQGEYVLLLRNGARLTSGRTYRERVREVFRLGS